MSSDQVGIKTVQEFMEAIWRKPRQDRLRRIFRGQAGDWPLLPRLFRPQTQPRTIRELRMLEKILLFEFEKRCPYLLPSVPKHLYDKMSLAQHYGLPTRLLDWSSNPLMALFFALDEANRPSPTVYIYDGSEENPNDPRRYVRTILDSQSFIQDLPTTVILAPARHSQRVVAQAGWHTVHPLGTDEESTHVEPMNTLKDPSDQLVVLPIDPERASDIRIELKDMGIDSATVYGDLSSVCREIEHDSRNYLPHYMRSAGYTNR
jgi:hypothetical protein